MARVTAKSKIRNKQSVKAKTSGKMNSQRSQLTTSEEALSEKILSRASQMKVIQISTKRNLSHDLKNAKTKMS